MSILNELSAQTLANYRAKALAQGQAYADRGSSTVIKAGKKYEKDGDANARRVNSRPGFDDLGRATRRSEGIMGAEAKWKAKSESERAGTLDKASARGYTPEMSLKNKFKSAIGKMSDADKAKDQKEREAIGKAKTKEAIQDRDRVKALSQKANSADARPEDIEAHRKERTAVAMKQLKNISGRDSMRNMASGVAQGAKTVAKAGLNAAKSGLSSLKKRVFGEEYYEDLDYRYTVIPLLDSLLEGNSSDIEYAFNEAVSHRIENAILTARLRIAEELDEARGMIDMGAGDVRRPNTPEERSEVAKALRTARSYNRAARNFEAKHPDDNKTSQASRMQRLNYRAKGAASGTVIHKDTSGAEYEKGVKMPNVDNPTKPKEARAAVWRDDSRPDDTGSNSHLKRSSPIRANQGKASWKKERPVMPD